MLFMSSMLAHVLFTITVILIRTQTSAQETSVFYVFSDDQQSHFNQCQVTKNCTLEALLSSNILSNNVSNTVVVLNPGVHTINSTVNQTFSINNATNFKLTAANLSERIIVKCNEKVGFSFRFCNKLTIQGINFEGCSRRHVINNFALRILHSTDINISAVMVRNSPGIGLLVINVRCSFVLSDSVFINNTCNNVLLISRDSVNIISRDTAIDIKNSRFEQVTRCSHSNGSTYIHPIGVVLTFIQTKFKMMALLSNVTLIQTIMSINGQSKLQMSISNISIKDTFYKTNPIVITNIPNITMKDITIQYTTGTVLFHKCNLSLQGQFIYRNNMGSLVLLKTKIVTHNITVIIRNNTAIHSAPLLLIWSTISIQNSSIRVKNNTGREGGGIVLTVSTVNFTDESKAIFLFNTGNCGGAMTFYESSQLLLHDGQTNFTFVGNTARKSGGAIYVQDTDYTRYNFLSQQNKERKFYKNFFRIYKGGQPRFDFYDNIAGQAGSAVFGGNVSYNFYFHNVSVNDTSVVSSIPFHVCTCVYSKPNCSIANITAKVQPGQSYTIEIIAVGQGNGTSPSVIGANFAWPTQAKLKRTEYLQQTGKTCTNLTYTVQYSESSHREKLQLITVLSTWRVKRPFHIIFDRKDCTVGFIFDSKTVRCVCNQDITDHGMECDIQTLKINRLPSKWVNATYEHLDPRVQQHGVIVHDYCPFDHCLANSQQLDLHYPDQQCNQNRAGILCGSCSNNFSHILGTSKCKQCTRPWIALIIPLIAVVGIVLVVGLIFLNLTVSVGTINGLIFYANIVSANNSIFFPQSISNSILRTFIAWLNLDLGIEMCFYNGLDAYSKTWFQFLFPLYIWFMLGAIIVVSHYSTRISRLVGRNAVQVLATLFLFSYARLLRIIIIAFSSTELVYPDGYHRRVWLYDGNVDYLKGKHIPLFMAALVLLIFVSFPFTMILFCIQCMQRQSNSRVLSWVGKLQPLFDAYTGPYKIKHRYWTGLLLLVRVCLFLVFSLNTIGNPMINLLAISIAVSCLLAYLSLIGGVYKQWWLNVIETAFILNLLVLSSGSFYQINTGTSIKPITYTSTGITLVLFICILVYHCVSQVMKTKFGQTIKSKSTESDYFCLLTIAKLKSGDQIELECNETRFKPIDEVTYSEVKLEEPLLERN